MCFLLLSAQAQQNATPQPTSNDTQPSTAAAPAPVQTPNPAPTRPTLEDGTPIKLRISQTVSSADAHVGQTVDFEVLEEVKVGDTLIVPKGGMAWATVTEAQSKRRMGRGGKLNMNIDSVRLVDGEKVALRAIKDVKGGGHVGAMTGAMVATGIVFFPAAPLFLFMHGKDITIPKGTEITAYVSGDVPLDLAKFQPDKPARAPLVVNAAKKEIGTLSVTSDPNGAEVYIDNEFAGNTPCKLTVDAGKHTIKVTAKDHKDWSRDMTIREGSEMTVNAGLEK